MGSQKYSTLDLGISLCQPLEIVNLIACLNWRFDLLSMLLGSKKSWDDFSILD